MVCKYLSNVYYYLIAVDQWFNLGKLYASCVIIIALESADGDLRASMGVLDQEHYMGTYPTCGIHIYIHTHTLSRTYTPFCLFIDH